VNKYANVVVFVQSAAITVIQVMFVCEANGSQTSWMTFMTFESQVDYGSQKN